MINAVPNLSATLIPAMPFPLPPFAEQQAIAERVAGLFRKVDVLAEQPKTA